MTAYACVRWRNFISVASDLTYKGTTNTPIEVDLRSQLLQGAKPLDQSLINTVGFQGAFRLTYKVVKQPKFGYLTAGTYGTGWVYHPNSNWNGTDTFMYVLNNGTQDSNAATVSIEIDKGLQAFITVYKAQNKPYWRLQGSYYIPPTYGHGGKAATFKTVTDSKTHKTSQVLDKPEVQGQYAMITYQWIETIPTLTYYLGVPYIYQEYLTIRNSTIQFDLLTGQPSVIEAENATDWYKFEWPYTNLAGYIPNTVIPYIQPPGPFTFTLRLDFYDQPQFEDVLDQTGKVTGKQFTQFNVHDSVEVDVVTANGADWYKNGLMQIVKSSDPDYPLPPQYT